MAPQAQCSARKRRVASGFSASLRATPGRPLRCRSTAGGSAFAFCPREGGTEELSGVFGGPPSLASNSAMRAFNAFTCASNSSMRSSLAAICASSWSIRANSGATRRAPSLFGESFFLCAMASVNQLAAVGSTPQTRVTTPQKVSSYLKTTIAARGENLIKGLRNLAEDIERGGGRLSLKMSDLSAFHFGKNIAISPGKVVFQNELMQLIQYAPSTPTVHRRPLLIIPPWINKFYILDLKPRNSFIKWCADQGHSVFVISWVNPGADLADKGFADYLLEGPMEALDAIKRATGEAEANLVGYCIGGTLTASALAYMAATKDRRVTSATLFTTLLDFADVGDISVFLDDAQLQLADEHMNRLGYLEGHHMAEAFNLLRENDLIWFFVVNNYLMGREPSAFDLLYWNSDSTRMPATMHSFYLRNMYHKNVLKDAGGINLANVPIDLRKIEIPVYFLSTREDHIAPWRSTYSGTQLVSGPARFVLGGSGHIAGIVNPPAAGKYCH